MLMMTFPFYGNAEIKKKISLVAAGNVTSMQIDFLSKQFYLAKPKSPIFKSGVPSLVDKSKFCKFEKNQQDLNQTQEMSN